MNQLLEYLHIPTSNAQFYLYGRNALYAVLALLKAEGCSSIAYPAYSCGDEIAPAVSLDYTISFYEVSHTLELRDVDTLFRHIHVLVITHYFGMVSAQTETIIRQAQAQGIIVIEDCAYAMYNPKAGIKGDYAVYSLRKHLPIPHGGLLKRVFSSPMPEPPLPPPAEAVSLEFATFTAYQQGRFKVGSGVHLSKSANPFGPRLDEFGGYRLGISSETLAMTETLPLASMLHTKQKEFARLYKFFTQTLPENALRIASLMPTVAQTTFLPLYVPNSGEAYAFLQQKGIHTIPFWDRYHPYIDWNRYNEAKQLKQSIISLPLTSNYSVTDLVEISDYLNRHYEFN